MQIWRKKNKNKKFQNHYDNKQMCANNFFFFFQMQVSTWTQTYP